MARYVEFDECESRTMKKTIAVPAMTLLVAAIAVTLPPAVVAEATQHASEVASSFDRFKEADDKFGFLRDNCMECHNGEDWAGSLAFDLISPNEIADNIEVWEKVISKLQGRMMPPAGQPRPDTNATEDFIAWVEDYLDHAATTEQHAGRVGLHRLNRKEYANAIEDLLAVKVDAESLLPPDTASDGFDNVANVLQVSPSFLEQYLQAARAISILAVGEAAPAPDVASFEAPSLASQYRHVEGLPLGTRHGRSVLSGRPTAWIEQATKTLTVFCATAALLRSVPFKGSKNNKF